MSKHKNLKSLVTRLRDDLNNPTKPISLLLIYAYNRTGKTRLSMEFKDAGKRKTRRNPTGTPDTLYFNAFTKDLFVWDNDLDGDRQHVNEQSSFCNAMAELALEPPITKHRSRYADFELLRPAKGSSAA
ncbi:hypothetical protein [Azospirillum griseum]|uniref:hypothetical protein n=1 Tax=Azospirillum griseum TaxID=2496639 RepID=UPI001AEC8E73|nr:hypothetical protein [Azospirillum griseum]